MLGWALNNNFEKEHQGSGGGGGKPRIRFGKTGPRGRMYGSTVAKGSVKGARAVAKSKFIKTGKGARAAIREHLRYIQERERGEREPERKFFDRSREDIERKEVFENMMQNRGDRAAMHTLILSPGDNTIDLKDYTRESMKALEERLGHDLNWSATIHLNTDHHHAHVVIAGKIPERERELLKELGYREDHEHEIEKRGNSLRSLTWRSEEKDVRELLGPSYDERAEPSDREDRRAEREFSSSEREETDPKVRDLLEDGLTRSVVEMKTERMLDRYERQMGYRNSAKDRGDVYLDVNDLKELRNAGNDYLQRERSFDREVERAFEREFGREYEHEPERERGHERDIEAMGWSDINRMFDSDKFLEEPEREHDRGDDNRGDGRTRGQDEDRERDDDWDRFDPYGRR